MPKREIAQFITYWSDASASERSHSQRFLTELCDLLEVPPPDNKPDAGYYFEYPITEHHADGTTSQGRVDLYKRGSFVLESKQFQEARAEASQLELAAEEAGVIPRKKSSQPVRGTGAWDDAMTKARGQAERYVRALPASELNPPFIVIVDVGHTFELFADFTQAGKAYLPYPDPRTFRIRLADLADEKIRDRLRLVWTNPAALDPSRLSADVTREVSAHLAELAKSLEQAGHEPEIVAQFLTRCLFCMFAEDVELLPERAFSDLLGSLPADGTGFQEVISQLFREMNTGTGKGISVVLRKKLIQFNGGLFSSDTVLPLNGLQLGLLREAARQNWGNVEPAIFGTLLERALNPKERHQLGAHFTPRAYVERLVLPTIIEPLRAEWEHVRAAAVTHARADRLKEARAVVNSFHEKLCNLKVLDPACGTGNFLYVSLQQLKVLEGEVLDLAAQFGENFKLELETHTVDPHQFLGIEINPRAASIAELVLWIGYLQWHFRLHGKRTPPEPILRAFKNIESRDAVLAYDGKPQPALDDAGNEITIWDRRSLKTDAVTGRKVPDETKRVPLLTYANPRPAQWPQADFIVGNPPYIGARTIRPALDDGYIEALRRAYPEIPENADLVMYWWKKAAELVRAGKANRFGIITTNSLRQSFNRQVTEAQLAAKPALSLAFAIPDHPWVDTTDGAAVRIAMTVGVPGTREGELWTIEDEKPQGDGSAKVSFQITHGKILPDIRTGAEISTSKSLKANEPFCCVGYQLTGTGFVLTTEEKDDLAEKDKIPRGRIFHPLLSARDITQETRDLWAIDLFGYSIESVRQNYPATFQQILTRVKPERDSNARASVRDRWWIYGEARSTFRPALADLKRAIVTPLTAKHRPFIFCDAKTIADSTTVLFALDDAFHLGVLSSRIHIVFSLVAGGTLEDRPRYNKSDCFDPFPFPLCGESEKARIRELAEALDAHRKQAQAKHGVTLTGIYNVLEKLRASELLNAKEKLTHDNGLVSVLKQLHDDLDAAVFAAYGWPDTLADADILDRLVALNAKRVTEEKSGIIHWLRPEYQAAQQPGRTKQDQFALPEDETPKKSKTKPAKVKTKGAWPASLAERVRAVEAALHSSSAPTTAAELAKQFQRANPDTVAEILETLVTIGRAHERKDGKFAP